MPHRYFRFRSICSADKLAPRPSIERNKSIRIKHVVGARGGDCAECGAGEWTGGGVADVTEICGLGKQVAAVVAERDGAAVDAPFDDAEGVVVAAGDGAVDLSASGFIEQECAIVGVVEYAVVGADEMFTEPL